VSGRPIACLAAEPVLTPRITWLTVGPRELRAALLLPSWYKPGTSLPVLMSPYGGPAVQLVLRMRSSSFCDDQWFAEHGFAVLVVDGRGTPGRGSAWVKTVNGDALSAPVEALLAVGRPHQVLPLSSATHTPTDENTVSQLLRHQLHFRRDALGIQAGQHE
jgi:dipeptidyl aminopeptidase/acylaminoacyl peptidase